MDVVGDVGSSPSSTASMQVPANVHGQTLEESPGIHVGGPDEAPGSGLWLEPVLAVVAFGE